MAKKYSSISNLESQRMRNQNNAIEILTKLDQSVSSNEEFVTVTTTNSNNEEINSEIPTIGYFKQRLDQVIKMVKTLAGVNDNASNIQIDNDAYKRIISADINKEPKEISQINTIKTFKVDSNWIFDEFLNPMISVELDLTDKIEDNTRYIESRRFIVEFEKIITIDASGEEIEELTPDAKIRQEEFNKLYKNNNSVDIVEFSTWLDNPGLVNRYNEFLIDTDFVRIEPNRLQFKGDFTITSTEIDSINRKLWYVLDTLTYYDISDPLIQPKPIDLKIGDLINVNPNNTNKLSTTVYRVVEISTITSEFRVRFELVFGEEPIHVRNNAISFYSDRVPNRTCKINVGFDEHCVVFLRQIGEISNLISPNWSPGVGFYTNELKLDNESGERFEEYYISKVYDYGLILEDLVQKKVPSLYGKKPNAPLLEEKNFAVVEVNAHLTQTVDAQRIRDLHSQKNNLTSEIIQIQNTVEKENRKLSTSTFESASDRKRIENNIRKLTTQLNSKNESKISSIQEILANKKNLNKIPAEYRLKGMWPMPEAVRSTKTKPQEIIQFEIWYRKLSKSGDENKILTITDLDNSAERQSTDANTTINKNIARPRVRNAAFSNWTKYKTDARTRVQDKITGEWKWDIVDVSDADTPNINQLDIPILPGEKIQIKIKSISEVGYPETPLESDFSNTLEYEFPDDMNTVLNEDDFILQEAQADEIKVQFEKELNARGLNIHLSTSIRDSDIYYAHTPQTISSGFKDNNGRLINLYDKLLSMNTEIIALKEQINRAKGVLEVYLSDTGNLTRIFNSNNLQFNINAEDYTEQTKIGNIASPKDSIARTYKNTTMVIDRFQIIIKNGAQDANLGILSYRGYGRPPGLQTNDLAYDGGNTSGTAGEAIQAMWAKSNGEIHMNEIPANSAGDISLAPRYATQQNNQWIWLQVKDLDGNYIYDSEDQTTNNFWDMQTSALFLNNGASAVHKTLTNTTKNLGFMAKDNLVSGSEQTQAIPAGHIPVDSLTKSVNWDIMEDGTNTAPLVGRFATNVVPVIGSLNDVINTSTEMIKSILPGDTNAVVIPINIYIKPNTGTLVYSAKSSSTITKFVDTLGGSLPVASQTDAVVPTTASNLLTITVDDPTFIKQYDRIVLDGFSDPSLTQYNNVILKVDGVSGNQIRFTVTVPASFSQPQSSLTLLQLHKRYEQSGGVFNYYNVLGKVGSDTRVVENYFELSPINTTPVPIVHNKKLRFYLEDENNIRPFDFQLSFNIKQYKEDNLRYVGTHIVIPTYQLP